MIDKIMYACLTICIVTLTFLIVIAAVGVIVCKVSMLL